ncbi:MAG: hypothetical protein OWR52_09915 [Acidibacillus sp.]|nr:hypothetical protein [Acidibacillus sp.]
MQLLEHVCDDITAILSLPERYRKRLNDQRYRALKEEIRRLDLFIRIDTNRASVIRLISEMLMAMDKKIYGTNT